jgi:hypothetical protein
MLLLLLLDGAEGGLKDYWLEHKLSPLFLSLSYLTK